MAKNISELPGARHKSDLSSMLIVMDHALIYSFDEEEPVVALVDPRLAGSTCPGTSPGGGVELSNIQQGGLYGPLSISSQSRQQ